MGNMKVVVFGAGAVGTWYGGWLKASGADVTFVARGETKHRLDTHPVELRGPQGITHVSVPVVEKLSDVDADVVIFATKTIGSVDLPPQLPTGAVLLTTQNSVELPTLAVEKYGADRVIPGVVRAFLHNVAPGVTEHDGNIQSLTIGSIHPATVPVVERIVAAFNATPITATIAPDIMADVWAKAMFVSPFGALGAVFAKPLGILRTRYRDSLRHLMEEVARTAEARGVELPDTIVADTLAFADAQSPEATSSMQRDIMAGKANELDAQIGAVIRMARRVDMELPAHRLVLDILSTRIG